MALIIGTAGHIDHGKTSLVKLLTGQDTDRLLAEKQRGISIDLGFAHFQLAGGEEVSIVDVPGHERFIRNMVAGVHGIDLVLFVVAADDGVMPQTEEHFDIVRTLGVERAIFAITKIDLVDERRISDVTEEIEILVDGSPLEGSPILHVSNTTGAGVENLKQRIAAAFGAVARRTAGACFRMPIDRVFSIHGRGVVITGTALSGTLASGDKVAIVPGGGHYRVRGLQCHGESVEFGNGGERLAINLVGADRTAFRRGDVACDPAIARGTHRIDVRLSSGVHAVGEIKNGQRVRLHLGTAERQGVVTLLGEDMVLERGQSALAQISVSEGLMAMARDSFVVRDAQAEHTLGGGDVLDPLGVRRPRSDPRRRAYLTALGTGNSAAAIKALVSGTKSLAVDAADLMFRMNSSEAELADLVTTDDCLVAIDAGGVNWITCSDNLDALDRRATEALAAFHADHPSLPGLSPEELRSRVAGRVDPHLFRSVVDCRVAAGRLVRSDAMLALPGHRAGLSMVQKMRAETLIAALNANPFAPPAVDIKDGDERTIIAHLERAGRVVRAEHGIVFSAQAFADAERRLEQYLAKNPEITMASFRDLLGTTRKYALALLETFDKTGRTVRIGDVRERGKALHAPDQ